MKKLFNKILASSFVALALVGCADLDTEPMGRDVTSEQKESVYESNPEMLSASVTGISSMFSVYMNITGSDHDDFGYPALMLGIDCRGVDMVSPSIGYNWFRTELEWRDCLYTSAISEMFWGTLYNQIYAANNVAGAVAEDTTDPTLQFYLAQAKAFRAFDYFVLAQLYQFTYKGHETSLCVPIITDQNANAAASEGTPIATVQEVYDQILADINSAVELLEKSDVKHIDKRYFDINVARGLRARINLVMQNWSAAAEDAQFVIDNSEATPYTITELQRPAFINAEDHAWLWGVIIAETDRVVTSGIVNFPSHMGSLNYGYASVGAWKWCNKKLYKAIPATDARKNWFLDENLTSPILNEEEQAYILSNNKGENPIRPYTQVKYAAYNNEVYTSTNACDIPLMRIEEMYLILAEAQAMAGNASQGASTLQTFVQTYRDPEYKCTAASAADVQEAVYQQRRIELWGEGLTWFDLKRLNKGANRLGGGYPKSAVFNIAATDTRMNYQIPQVEIEGNLMLDDSYVDTNASNPDPIDDEE